MQKKGYLIPVKNDNGQYMFNENDVRNFPQLYSQYVESQIRSYDDSKEVDIDSRLHRTEDPVLSEDISKDVPETESQDSFNNREEYYDELEEIQLNEIEEAEEARRLKKEMQKKRSSQYKESQKRAERKRIESAKKAALNNADTQRKFDFERLEEEKKEEFKKTEERKKQAYDKEELQRLEQEHIKDVVKAKEHNILSQEQQSSYSSPSNTSQATLYTMNEVEDAIENKRKEEDLRKHESERYTSSQSFEQGKVDETPITKYHQSQMENFSEKSKEYYDSGSVGAHTSSPNGNNSPHQDVSSSYYEASNYQHDKEVELKRYEAQRRTSTSSSVEQSTSSPITKYHESKKKEFDNTGPVFHNRSSTVPHDYTSINSMYQNNDARKLANELTTASRFNNTLTNIVCTGSNIMESSSHPSHANSSYGSVVSRPIPRSNGNSYVPIIKSSKSSISGIPYNQINYDILSRTCKGTAPIEILKGNPSTNQRVLDMAKGIYTDFSNKTDESSFSRNTFGANLTNMNYSSHMYRNDVNTMQHSMVVGNFQKRAFVNGMGFATSVAMFVAQPATNNVRELDAYKGYQTVALYGRPAMHLIGQSSAKSMIKHQLHEYANLYSSSNRLTNSYLRRNQIIGRNDIGIRFGSVSDFTNSMRLFDKYGIQRGFGPLSKMTESHLKKAILNLDGLYSKDDIWILKQALQMRPTTKALSVNQAFKRKTMRSFKSIGMRMIRGIDAVDGAMMIIRSTKSAHYAAKASFKAVYYAGRIPMVTSTKVATGISKLAMKNSTISNTVHMARARANIATSKLASTKVGRVTSNAHLTARKAKVNVSFKADRFRKWKLEDAPLARLKQVHRNLSKKFNNTLLGKGINIIKEPFRLFNSAVHSVKSAFNLLFKKILLGVGGVLLFILVVAAVADVIAIASSSVFSFFKNADGEDVDDVQDSLAMQTVNEVLTPLIEDWQADMKDEVNRTPEGVNNYLNEPITSYDRVYIQYYDADGNEVGYIDNTKQILSMATVMFMDNPDVGKFQSYVERIWKDSHVGLYDDKKRYSTQQSDVYYCSGCMTRYYSCTDTTIKHEVDNHAIGGCTKKITKIPITKEIFDEATYTYVTIETGEYKDEVSYYCPADNPQNEEDKQIHEETYCPGHVDIYVKAQIYTFNEEGFDECVETIFDVDSFSFDNYLTYIGDKYWEGWNEENQEYARHLFSMDWQEMYGVSFNGLGLSDDEIGDLIGDFPLYEANEIRQRIVSFALSLVGKIPYVYNGTEDRLISSGLHTGIDCSGYVCYVYGQVTGDYLGKTTAAYLKKLGKNATENPRPGDILVKNDAFGTSTSSTNHAGIFVREEGDFIYYVHCSSSNNGVVVSKMSKAKAFGPNGYWKYVRSVLGEEGDSSDTSFTKEELELFQRVVWAETGSSSKVGSVNVATVILNRLTNRNFPNNLTDILTKPNQFAKPKQGNIPNLTKLAVLEAINNRSSADKKVLFFCNHSLMSDEKNKEWKNTYKFLFEDEIGHSFYTFK